MGTSKMISCRRKDFKVGTIGELSGEYRLHKKS